VNFNDEVYLDADFTNDTKVLEHGLARIDSRGGTAMRDAIRMSIDHLKEKAKRDKKVILLVTDDNASAMSLDALVRLAQKDDVLVYAIGLLADEDKREASKAKRALGILVESTGARSFTRGMLRKSTRSHMRSRTTSVTNTPIAYTPSNVAFDGTYRQIKLALKAPGNPVGRTRSGYYAVPDKTRAAVRNPL
jgi:VWFA-related protein